MGAISPPIRLCERRVYSGANCLLLFLTASRRESGVLRTRATWSRSDETATLEYVPHWLRATPRTALTVGLGGVALVTVVAELWPSDVHAEIPALLMLIPIVAATVLSDWRIGVPVAVVAGIAHTLLFIEPRGVISVGYTQDIMTILTFVGVAVIVSVIASRRSIKNHGELIGHERMLLLRSVAHDIRSPLNVILTASTELRDGADHDAVMRHRLLGLVVDEARRLDRVVDNMLNLSRLQAGALVPSCAPVELVELVEQTEARFDRLSHQDDSLLVGELPDVTIDVDAVQIDQVLTNLVENAVRHGGSPARVTIRGAIDGDVVRVFVDDEGVGFSDAARAQLFAPFTSTDNSSGLGLSVCKAIVEAHGGAIAVADSSSGGTSISFTVPRAG